MIDIESIEEQLENIIKTVEDYKLSGTEYERSKHSHILKIYIQELMGEVE